MSLLSNSQKVVAYVVFFILNGGYMFLLYESSLYQSNKNSIFSCAQYVPEFFIVLFCCTNRT